MIWKRQGSTLVDIISNKSLINSMGFINGSFTTEGISGSNVFPVRNPANNDILAVLPRMDAENVVRATNVANEAFQKWKNTTAVQRSKILLKMADLMTQNSEDLAKIITLESGKPLAEARGEIMYATSFYEYYAEEAKRNNG